MKNLEFDRLAFEDLAWWVEYDRKQVLKIIKLIQEVQREPFERRSRYTGYNYEYLFSLIRS